MIEQKTFLYALETVPLNARKAETFLKDKRLTSLEKTILECCLDLRKNKNQEIIDRLNNLNATNNIVDGFRLLILATAFNNSNNPKDAIHAYQESEKKLKNVEGLERQKFIIKMNLFYSYLNLNHRKKVIDRFNELKEMKIPNDYFKVAFEICKLETFILENQFNEAISQLHHCLKMNMNTIQQVTLHVAAIELFTSQKDYKKAQSHLELLKENRNFLSSANYKFIKSVFYFIQADKPIYLYEKDFKNEKHLLYQLKVLLALESHNYSEAYECWNYLSEYNLQIYGDNLSYHGRTCLFSIALEKLNQKSKTVEMDIGKESKEKMLVMLLKSSPSGINKEDLYFYIWQTQPHYKSEFDKLKQLVAHVRKKENIEIKSRKGRYFISDLDDNEKESA